MIQLIPRHGKFGKNGECDLFRMKLTNPQIFEPDQHWPDPHLTSIFWENIDLETNLHNDKLLESSFHEYNTGKPSDILSYINELSHGPIMSQKYYL